MIAEASAVYELLWSLTFPCAAVGVLCDVDRQA